MKKLFLLFLLFVLTSCNNSHKLITDYEMAAYINVYAYNIEHDRIEKIEVDYKILNPEDVFLLYTTNQNYLPIGYSSCAYTNVSILSIEETSDEIIYHVDNYIKLVDNIEVFHNLVSKTNELLYNKNTIIINNNTIIA